MHAARNNSASDKSHRNLRGYIGDRDSSHCLDESSTEIANGDGSSSDCTSETDPNLDRSSPTDNTFNLEITTQALQPGSNYEYNSQNAPSTQGNSTSNWSSRGRSQIIKALPELMQPLPHNMDDAMREAIYLLPPLEVRELIHLIHVLRQIDGIDLTSISTPKLSKDATDYLVKRLEVLQTNRYPPEFLQTKSAGLLDGIYWIWNGIEINSQVIDLDMARKQHIIELAYFLQGKRATEEERSYIREILLSYLREISDFRGLPRFTM